MKVLLFLAKGFETMEASVFIDVMGWAKTDHHHDIDVVTCGFSKTVTSSFGLPVIVDMLVILNTNKTIDKKSSHNPYMQDYARFFV